MLQFGFIGIGNMGGAIAKAVCKKVDPKAVVLTDKDMDRAKALAEEIGCMSGSMEDVFNAKYIVLGVKPDILKKLLPTLSEALLKIGHRFVLVSMAAGITTEKITELSGKDFPVIRIMPNMPMAIGEGMTVYSTSGGVMEEEIKEFTDAMSESGMVEPIDEALIDAASAVSGCGPAFAAMFIEALSDGAVKCGLPRSMALKLAAQTVLGTGAMVKKGNHPALLKDAVTSPKGTTIEGVHALEERNFRGAVISACEASYLKNKKL